MELSGAGDSVICTSPGQIVAEITERIYYTEKQLAIDVSERGTLPKRLVVGRIVRGVESAGEDEDQYCE